LICSWSGSGLSGGMGVLCDGVEPGLDEELGPDHGDEKNCGEGGEERSNFVGRFRPLPKGQKAGGECEGVSGRTPGAEAVEDEGLNGDEPDGRAGGDDGEGKLALEKVGAAVRVVAGGGEGEHGHHQENRQCQEGDGDRADA